MSSNVVPHPAAPRVDVNGWGDFWTVRIEPMAEQWKPLLRLCSSREEAVTYAHSIADPRGWTVWVRTRPGESSGDDNGGGAAA